MKKKCALCAVIIFIILIPFGIMVREVSATAVLSLTPSVVPTESLTTGSLFQLSVHVDGISNLWAWSISVSWNASVLEMAGSPTEGPFLKNGYTTIFLPSSPNNEIGWLDEQAGSIFGAGGVSGSGDLAFLQFKVIGYGSSSIDMNGTLMDYGTSGNHVQIPCTTVGATFSLQDPSTPSPTPSPTSSPTPSPATSGSHGPTASFVPSNGTVFSKGELITLDASLSTPGYDVGGTNETCPITNYAWRVEYTNGTVLGSFSGKTASFNATTSDALRVILIVTAPDPTPPSGTGFVSTDTCAAIIVVENVSSIAVLDVFTNKGGIGYNVNSSAFSPQELVKVYAQVTYHNAGVANKDVAFAIKSPNGTVTGIRVGRTNSSGCAYIDFRLPWPNPDPSNVLGIWTITASVDVSQQTLNDTVSFNYNYLITTSDIQLPAYAQKSTNITINVTLDSISDNPLWSRLAITIYDEANVPVGFFTTQNTNQVKGDTAISASMLIASWAFVGEATVYVDVLTEFPDKGGVPYCEEVKANFQIQP